MVQRDLASLKIARARAHLVDAEAIFAKSREAFLADRKERDLALFYLFLAIQECIDLAAHWITDDDLPSADGYAASFRLLAEHGRLDLQLADEMGRAAGLRNLIIHGYATLDPGKVHAEARDGIPAVRRFLETLARAAGL